VTDRFEVPEQQPRSAEVAQAVKALTLANQRLLADAPPTSGRRVLPSRTALEWIVAELRAALFPAHFGAADLSFEGMRDYVSLRLDGVVPELREQVRRGLCFVDGGVDADGDACTGRAHEITREFMRRLPDIRALLGTDARAAYEGDPAATSVDEAIFCYPGIAAVTYHRIAHQLYELGVRLIARIVSEIAHGATGVDIHPGARIAGSFFIDHGTGVVIGETTVIGERVRLYQGVTLGAKSFPVDEHGRPIKGRARHPIVEDDVTIYAGATILGRVTIGRGSSIGGNVWLTRTVPPGSFITQARTREDTFDAGAGI
jgi:serine O-acetyltransferase